MWGFGYIKPYQGTKCKIHCSYPRRGTIPPVKKPPPKTFPLVFSIPCRIYSYSRQLDLIFWIYTYYYQLKSIDRPEARGTMSSTDQVFRRVGRGGAGNWYSKKDVEEAEKTQATAVGCPFAFCILLLRTRHPEPADEPSSGTWEVLNRHLRRHL